MGSDCVTKSNGRAMTQNGYTETDRCICRNHWGFVAKKSRCGWLLQQPLLLRLFFIGFQFQKRRRHFGGEGQLWTTLESLLVFYSITFLQRMMEKRRNLSNAQVALNGLFNNNRVNASIVPFMLGMLPAASTVLICGPIVRGAVKNSDLTVPEQASITSYYRHIFRELSPDIYK